jgi:hypothetical protein
VSISAIALHLRPGVREHYLGWLENARPDLVALYEDRFTGRNGPRSYQPKAAQDELSATVRRLQREAGFQPGVKPTYERDQVEPVAAPVDEQLTLL